MTVCPVTPALISFSLSFLLFYHVVSEDVKDMLVDWRSPVAGGTSTIADRARLREQTEVTQRKRLTEAGQVLFDVSREVTSIHPHGMLNSSKHSGYDQERMSTKKQAPVSLKKRHSPTKLHLNVVFLLPAKDFYLFSYKHVLPAFDVAKNKFLHDVNITVRYNDTKCNSRNAPIALFDFYSQDLVDVVFGPVCDFSLAPVARYTPVWNVPVITSGGFAHDFDEKQKLDSEYNTLTRMGPNFSSMSEYILHLLKTFGWKKLQLLYDQAGKDYIMEKFCFLAASTIIFSCKMKKTENDFHLYIPDSQDIGKMLTEKVGLKYSGRCVCVAILKRLKATTLAQYTEMPVLGAMYVCLHCRPTLKMLVISLMKSFIGTCSTSTE